MVATRDIAALDTILVERAAACGPKLRHPAVCVECLAEVEPGIIKCRKPVICGFPKVSM